MNNSVLSSVSCLSIIIDWSRLEWIAMKVKCFRSLDYLSLSMMKSSKHCTERLSFHFISMTNIEQMCWSSADKHTSRMFYNKRILSMKKKIDDSKKFSREEKRLFLFLFLVFIACRSHFFCFHWTGKHQCSMSSASSFSFLIVLPDVKEKKASDTFDGKIISDENDFLRLDMSKKGIHSTVNDRQTDSKSGRERERERSVLLDDEEKNSHSLLE